MKVHEVKDLAMPLALHIANRNKILTIKYMGNEAIKYGGIPAVLTDGVGWYSAELITVPDEHLPLAAAVNGYADRVTAIIDAEKR